MEATRTRILSAARSLILEEDGPAHFSLEAVAKRAGVTRMTIYQRFGSKRGLIEALFDNVAARAHLAERLPSVFSHPNFWDACRLLVNLFCDFWDNDRVLNRRLRGFAAMDGEFADSISARNARRSHALEVLLHRLGPRATVHRPIEHQKRLQTLSALTSFEFYDILAGELGPEETASTILRLVKAAIEAT